MKHQTSQNQYQRGSRAPSHVRPYDGEWNLSLHLSCPTIVYGAGSRRLCDADAKRKAGYDQHNKVTTTTSKEPTPKKTTTLCSDAATRQSQPPTSRNTKHYRTSTREEVVPPHTYAPTMENGTCHSVCPARQRFTAWTLTMTRWARAEMVVWFMGSTYGYRNNNDTNNTTTKNTDNNNTTHSSERQFETYNILQLHS